MQGQESDWLKKLKSITLLSSTRNDVINLYGQPRKEKTGHWDIFDIMEGEITVEYSEGKCRTSNLDGKVKNSGYLVPEWTVVNVAFFPKKKFTLKNLKIDVTGFNSYPVYDVPGAKIYENNVLGAKYDISSKGKIEYISFTPADKHDYLLCK